MNSPTRLLLAAIAATIPSLGRAGETLSAADWSALRAARYDATLQDGAYEARNPAQSFVTRFDERGFLVRCAAGKWSFGLALREIAPTRSEASGSFVTLARGTNVEEWWINGERGLEHGLTLRERPARSDGESLRLVFDVRGDLLALPSDDGLDVSFVDEHGAATISYAHLVVFDADDRELPARFVCDGSALSLVIDDRGARYPLTVDPIAQQAYFKASNSGANDTFGAAVAISSNTVVIGAPGESSGATGVDGNQNDDSSLNSGAAYVFARNGTSWTQQAYLKASAGEPGDLFGTAVAVARDTVMIGAPGESSGAVYLNGDEHDNSALNAGAVYVFTRVGTTWSQAAYVKASNSDAHDRFGSSVAAFIDTFLVGAPGEGSAATGVNGNEGDNSAPGSGAVYVFTVSGSSWIEQAYLKASNTGIDDRFGTSIAGDANSAVVGAPGEDSQATGVNGIQANESAPGSGAAYVFNRFGAIWTQQAYLKASNTDAGDAFGSAVALAHVPTSGPVVDDPPDGGLSSPGNPGTGGHPGTWAIAPHVVVVGAPHECSGATGVNGNAADNGTLDAGAAYIFVSSTATWSQRAYLKAPHAGALDHFGAAVAISEIGDVIAVGAPDEDGSASEMNGDVLDDSCTDAGAVFVFARSGTGWTTNAYVKPSNTGTGDHFGTAVAISLRSLVVGVPFEDSGAHSVNGMQADETRVDAGAAFAFMIADHPTPTPFCAGDGSGAACPCANVGALGSGCANGTMASGARLQATGVAGIAAPGDSLVLTATNVTGLALFAQASPAIGWIGVNFGDGILCLSGTPLLLGTVQPAAGSAAIPNALSPTAIHVSGLVTQPGSVRAYQALYRDASAFCTPAVLNTTAALLVTWGG